MIPDTWLPTWTVVTADRAPEAVTVGTTLPRSIFWVRNFGTWPFARARYAPPPSPTTTTAAPTIQPFLDIELLTRENGPSEARRGNGDGGYRRRARRSGGLARAAGPDRS